MMGKGGGENGVNIHHQCVHLEFGVEKKIGQAIRKEFPFFSETTQTRNRRKKELGWQPAS
jgi:hypothetical protein